MIEIKELTKSFGEKKLFTDFNYQIPDGIMLAIVGKSGSGKSTLLNMIGLLDCHYTGSILYDGIDIRKEREVKRRDYIRNNINYLFQNYALIDDETVLYNLLLALEYEKVSKIEKLERIKKALEKVELSGYEYKKIYTLSGGEQQRIALARMILKRGKFILCDEPTGNLDYHNAMTVMKILKEFQKDGKTIIIVTHDKEIAKQCDDMVFL